MYLIFSSISLAQARWWWWWFWYSRPDISITIVACRTDWRRLWNNCLIYLICSEQIIPPRE